MVDERSLEGNAERGGIERAETPSAGWLPIAAIGLSLIGLADAGYLTWLKLFGGVAACAGIGDCEAVNNSIYAEIHGIPIAALGAAAYLALTLVLVGAIIWPGQRENAVLAFFGIALAGMLYSAYLTYIEIAVLHAVCPFCVGSAVVMTLLFVLSAVELRSLTSHQSSALEG